MKIIKKLIKHHGLKNRNNMLASGRKMRSEVREMGRKRIERKLITSNRNKQLLVPTLTFSNTHLYKLETNKNRLLFDCKKKIYSHALLFKDILSISTKNSDLTISYKRGTWLVRSDDIVSHT